MSISQAGRRGFDPRLPLHFLNSVQDFDIRATSFVLNELFVFRGQLPLQRCQA
jgi:hypothetical protein